MNGRYLLVFISILIAGCQGKQEPRESEDPLYFLLKRLDAAEKAKDRVYHDARKIILEAGWMPFTMNPESDDSQKHGNMEEFRKRGYSEVEECRGIQPPFCNFIFKDLQDNKLFVTTAGRESPERKEFATVTYTQVIGEYRPSNDE